MTEALLAVFQRLLRERVKDHVKQDFGHLVNGDYAAIFRSDTAQTLLGHINAEVWDGNSSWTEELGRRIDSFCRDASPSQDSACRPAQVFIIGYAALLSFLQANITGPPLDFEVEKTIVARDWLDTVERRQMLKADVLACCALDGIAPYKLVPQLELFWLAATVFDNFSIRSCAEIEATSTWALARALFIQQRLLLEISPSLQRDIFENLARTEEKLLGLWTRDERAEFILEMATVESFHGLDRPSREHMDQAGTVRDFKFALTGALGKRTKFQKMDLSQLVVLARSIDGEPGTDHVATKDGQTDDATGQLHTPEQSSTTKVPQALDLNDDTLLEKISFAEKAPASTDIKAGDAIDPALASLDPSNQPRLEALDSIILLALASSITNTSPTDGLTREETLPYAVRVIEGGSSNWQVYTQALLLRSRIEGYRSRTVERGLLQLQALVDQVIADTTGSADGNSSMTATTFLPRPTESESAPASIRLRYIFQLASPTRWSLEAELAQRWVSLGGLRSALEIYERLEMWAEAALCWAATEREDKARALVRRELFLSTSGQETSEDENELWQGAERVPRPSDAPRLYCILGDIDRDVDMYEKAWEVSGQRYARAQRSLGRLYLSAKDYDKAAASYSKSLKVNQLNQTSWFALGCCNLSLARFDQAVDAFTRCVQLDDKDAESWSNLAAALLRQGPDDTEPMTEDQSMATTTTTTGSDPQKRRREALGALQRAATLKHESFRIWENVMVVAASISPPDLLSILNAQANIIKLRGKQAGETCVDVEIVEKLVRCAIASSDTYDSGRPGFERRLVNVVDSQIVPLITTSRPLWILVARLAMWRGNPAAALEAYEKGWRAVCAVPGWESSADSSAWTDVVDATVELCDAYESLGPRERTSGLAAGQAVLVARDWKFKARSTLGTVMGRAKDAWEGSAGWGRLEDALSALKGASE